MTTQRVRPNCLPDSSVCKSPCAAMALFLAMRSVSYDHFGTPWAPHLEKTLWRDRHEQRFLTPAEAHTLTFLHQQAGGWWSWRRQESPGPTFVRSEGWAEIFERG